MTTASTSLRDKLDGDVLGPGDDGWDVARQPWNLAFQQHPAAVVLAESADDVAAAIDFARGAGLRVATQSSGHGAGGYGELGDDTLLLRMSRLVGAEVVEPASEHGLAALAGSSPEVGVVGYTLGGGIGWLARRDGLASERVASADVVTADGRRLRVDRDNEPDFFWALRGGGGSFAVVLALEFELVELPEAYAGSLFFPFERSAEVLHAWREWTAGVPDEMQSAGRMIQLPPLPVIPEPLRGRSFGLLQAAYAGPAGEGEELVKPLRDLGAEIDTFDTVAPAALSVLHNDPEDPVPGLGGHAVLDALPAEAIDALVEAAGPGSGSPLLGVELRQLGGALAAPPDGAGALGAVPGEFMLFGVGMVPEPAAREAVEGALERVKAAVEPWVSGRSYLNFRRHAGRPVDRVLAGGLGAVARGEGRLRPGRRAARQPPGTAGRLSGRRLARFV